MEYVYASLLLKELGKEINETNLKAVIEAAGGEADEGKIKSLVSSLKGVDIDKVLSESISIPTTTQQISVETQKTEEKKEERKEEAEGLSILFG